MRILTGKKWRDGYLDYYRNPTEYRVQILAFKNLERLSGVYHTRQKSLRLLWNYFPVVGLEGLITKTWSRLREGRRNEKYVSYGIGKIIEGPDNGALKAGDTVGLIAPLHPALPERIVLPEELIFQLEKSDIPELKEDAILYSPLTNIEISRYRDTNISGHKDAVISRYRDSEMSKDRDVDMWWEKIKGWSMYSGMKISQETQKELEDNLKKEIKENDWADQIDAKNPSAVAETKGEIQSKGSKKRGILFGFGNYAKINIVPYMKPFVNIQTVHEADPTQISGARKVQKWDTSPFPKENEEADVYFVASYNNTHVPTTLHALRQGAYVVVEKPVVMDYEDLDELEKALRKVGRKLFIGFHKRYGVFNKMALEDLDIKKGDPISYHSIVYELVQPKFFWYNWPISRSTFFANGCHQIDHFLHLNDFSKPKDSDIKLMQDGSVEVWIELENGACFTTTFSEKGTSRVGPRDFVELKVPNKNIRITDAIKYQSEDNNKIIRKKRIFKTNSYKTMYQTIGKTIAENGDGDSIESILVSAKIMLDLEEKLQKMKGWGNRYKQAKEEFARYFK
ncbi:hypothetical protein CL629_04575 [bacterium]|nr:hypothetical protein [bacterium]